MVATILLGQTRVCPETMGLLEGKAKTSLFSKMRRFFISELFMSKKFILFYYKYFLSNIPLRRRLIGWRAKNRE